MVIELIEKKIDDEWTEICLRVPAKEADTIADTLIQFLRQKDLLIHQNLTSEDLDKISNQILLDHIKSKTSKRAEKQLFFTRDNAYFGIGFELYSFPEIERKLSEKGKSFSLDIVGEMLSNRELDCFVVKGWEIEFNHD